MIVSFDLDDTLLVDPTKVAIENPLRFPYSLIYKERLRLGTIQLLLKIRENGIKLWVYTTSFRSERYIKLLFKHYGIIIDEVLMVNDIKERYKEIKLNLCHQNIPLNIELICMWMMMHQLLRMESYMVLKCIY